MTNQEHAAPSQGPSDEYQAGQRSITKRRGPSRFDMVREKKRRSLKSRPYLIAGALVLLGLMAIPVVAFINTYVMPPRQLAIQVGEVKYTRGDVVELIRFNQRLSEELGIPFQLGTSVFDILQVIQEAELSYQLAPRYGISVDQAEVEERIDYILGIPATTEEDRNSPEFQVNREEAKRQFLNRVGLPEEVWRDFIMKIIYQERLREHIGTTVPRIQQQVHVYEIILTAYETSILSQINRDLTAGRPVVDTVLQYSQDTNVRRTNGDKGWIPQGMLANQFDRILWGLDANGNRILPFKQASTPIQDSQSGLWSVLIIDEYQEARELSPEALEALTDSAFTTFMNQERRNTYVYLDLNSEIANWVNSQVRLNAIDPTPGAQSTQVPGLLPGVSVGGPQATAVPTPRGIPGISGPSN